MSSWFPIRQFDDKAVLRTDEQITVSQAYVAAERIFDTNNPPTQIPINQGKNIKPKTFKQFDQLDTGGLGVEPDLSQAVRQAYPNS